MSVDYEIEILAFHRCYPFHKLQDQHIGEIEQGKVEVALHMASLFVNLATYPAVNLHYVIYFC